MTSSFNRNSARAIAQAAHDKAAELGIAVTVAVVAPDASPILVDRMDGARAVTVRLAIGKAKAAALWGQPSGDLATRFESAPQLTSALISQWDGEFVAVGGAVPLEIDGIELGAVGVSGGSAAQDVECATHAAALIAEMLPQ